MLAFLFVLPVPFFLPASAYTLVPIMARGTVLVVDDEEHVLAPLARVIRDCGFDVLTAADGETATAALSTTSIDIVLTDLSMPRMDGYALIRWIHAHSLTQPVIVLSAHSSIENAVQALRLGAYDYITKPFSLEDVEAALCRAEASVERRRADAALRQRNRELAALNAISAAVSSSLELDEMLEHALSAIVEALELTGAIIYLNGAHDQLILHRSYDLSTGVATRIPSVLPLPLQSGIALGAAQIAQMIGNVEQIVWHNGDIIQAAIPLLEQGTPRGLLLLVRDANRPMQPDQLALLQSIGNYIGVAIANVYLYKQVRDSASLLERLVTRRTQELQHSRDLLRTIFDGIPGGLLLADTHERVLAANRAYANLLGQQPHMLNKQIYSQVWSAPWARSAAQLVQRCISGGQPIYQRDRLERPGSSPIVLDHYLFPVYDATGKVTQVIEYLEDVTERLALERALTQTEQLAALGKLAATVAHEVNTPLLAIRGCLGLIANPMNDPAARAEYLALAENELDRAATIIRVMLDFYQSTGSERRAIGINPLITRVAQLLKAECTQHNVAVELCLDPALPHIFVTPDQIKQVILNLMLNAIEALPDGGKITLRTSLRTVDQRLPTTNRSFEYHGAGFENNIASGNQNSECEIKRPAAPFVVIEVEDTGGGVPRAIQEQLFDAFVTTKPNGSGLGLAVCRTVVQNQGGDISFENISGGGARFTVAFPVPEAGPQTTVQVPQSVDGEPVRPGHRSSFASKGEDL